MTPVADRAGTRIGARIGARLGLAGRAPALVAVIAAIGLALLGADLFGLVHVVGGTLRGNDRATAFGVELAAVSTVLLGGLAWIVRRSTIRR